MGRGKFTVNTQPTKDVVVSGLTRDASVHACIFDLIDNAIDAALEHEKPQRKRSKLPTLPASYAGYRIALSIDGHDFSIADNCGGITVAQMKQSALRFGAPSHHELGIGVFGVGLNRAIFRLGKKATITTDTGKERSRVNIDAAAYLDASGWDWPAEEFQSTGKPGTEVEISNLPAEIAREFADEDWVDDLRDQIGQRFGRFIEKGLRIAVNGVLATNDIAQIRDDGPYDGQEKVYTSDDGVYIEVKFGQHSDHRFTNEPDYDADRNKEITSEFGWTVLCNDRAILFSDKSSKTGWDRFHTEFYGFVGIVSFIGDPSKLPWNTTKTDVDLNNPSYQQALTDMRHFAESWRKLAERRKKRARKGETDRPLPARAKRAPKKSAKTPKPRTNPPVRKDDHNQFRTVLPDDVTEIHCYDKHLALVHEAKGLDLTEATYAGLALIRMLFEVTVVKYADRHSKTDALKEFAVTRRGKKIKLSPEDAKRLVPTMDEMLAFMEGHPNEWGGRAQYLKHSVGRMGARQKILNSAVHNPFQAINKTEAFQIRDEILPVLRHLIET